MVVRSLYLLLLMMMNPNIIYAQNTPSKSSPQQRFINSLNQQLQEQNQQLVADRLRIDNIAKQYLQEDDISEADFNWIKQLAEDYQLAPQKRGDHAFFAALLHRVDVVPASLAIAQAIIETGWNEASSSKNTHNPFGIRCGKQCQKQQLIPFPNQKAAIIHYIHLLNTSPVYESFRQLRAQARTNNKKLRGEQLANGLSRYSSQGQQYIEKVKQTIVVNQLTKLD